MPGKTASVVLTQTHRRSKPNLPSRRPILPRQEVAVGNPHVQLLVAGREATGKEGKTGDAHEKEGGEERSGAALLSG